MCAHPCGELLDDRQTFILGPGGKRMGFKHPISKNRDEIFLHNEIAHRAVPEG